MFLYYLVDLQGPDPQILHLYFGKQSHFSKEQLIKQYLPLSQGKLFFEKIVYSRVPLTEICGLDHLCNDKGGMGDMPSKNIFFFYLGGYEFYYSIGKTVNDAANCINHLINHEKWPLIEKIISDRQYDSFSLDHIQGNPITGMC